MGIYRMKGGQKNVYSFYRDNEIVVDLRARSYIKQIFLDF